MQVRTLFISFLGAMVVALSGCTRATNPTNGPATPDTAPSASSPSTSPPDASAQTPPGPDSPKPSGQ